MHFCRSEFWNTNLTWNTEAPQLTQCFQSTVLVYLPLGVLVLGAGLDLASWAQSRVRSVPWAAANITKLVLTSLALGLACLELTAALVQAHSTGEMFLTDLIAPGVKMASYGLSISLLVGSRHYGQVMSPAQFLFWTINSLCLGLTWLSIALGGYKDIIYTNIVFIIISFIISVIMFIFNWFADNQPLYADLLEQADDNPCPKRFASFPSRLLYSWADSFLIAGYKNPPTQEDLWSLNTEDKLSETIPALEKKMNDTGKISIMSSLFKCYWKTFISLTIFYISKSLLTLVSPQIINLVIGFIEEDEPVWKGYLYMVLFGVVTVG